ncbi:MAG: hypothetical protein WCA79_17050 [Anaerolineales bacterium]
MSKPTPGMQCMPEAALACIVIKCVVANPYPWRGSDSLNPLLFGQPKEISPVNLTGKRYPFLRGNQSFYAAFPKLGAAGNDILMIAHT